MSFTETVQQSGQLLDHIKNHPMDWNLAITWIVIVAVGCWLWAEFIEFLESRRMRRRFSRPQMAGPSAEAIGGKRSIVFADLRRPVE